MRARGRLRRMGHSMFSSKLRHSHREDDEPAVVCVCHPHAHDTPLAYRRRGRLRVDVKRSRSSTEVGRCGRRWQEGSKMMQSGLRRPGPGHC